MKTYRTSEIAEKIGVHPNTVRLYEKLNLIPKAERRPNGYRVFTEFHIEQFRLARTALEVEVLQNGLRRRAVAIVKAAAAKNLPEAERLIDLYLQEIRCEQRHAEEAIESVRRLIDGGVENGRRPLKRREAADFLGISIDTLRNWEMNGLLTVKRRQNGYRIYTNSDLNRLRIIRSLRCANYSLSAILRMLSALSCDPCADIRQIIDTPEEEETIITACDKLLTSLSCAEQNARSMKKQLQRMKRLL